jgi:hypothetical protein
MTIVKYRARTQDLQATIQDLKDQLIIAQQRRSARADDDEAANAGDGDSKRSIIDVRRNASEYVSYICAESQH